MPRTQGRRLTRTREQNLAQILYLIRQLTLRLRLLQAKCSRRCSTRAMNQPMGMRGQPATGQQGVVRMPGRRMTTLLARDVDAGAQALRHRIRGLIGAIVL